VQTARVSNVFYAPGQERAAKVNDLFASIGAAIRSAERPAKPSALHRLWKRRVIRLAKVSTGKSRASIYAAGTGDIALGARAARRGNDRPGLQPAKCWKWRKREVRSWK